MSEKTDATRTSELKYDDNGKPSPSYEVITASLDRMAKAS